VEEVLGLGLGLCRTPPLRRGLGTIRWQVRRVWREGGLNGEEKAEGRLWEEEAEGL